MKMYQQQLQQQQQTHYLHRPALPGPSPVVSLRRDAVANSSDFPAAAAATYKSNQIETITTATSITTELTPIIRKEQIENLSTTPL